MLDLHELHDALESACLDVMDGSPPSRLQATRVERAIVELLARRGLRGQVEVRAGGQLARVVVIPVGPRARRVTLQLRLG